MGRGSWWLRKRHCRGATLFCPSLQPGEEAMVRSESWKICPVSCAEMSSLKTNPIIKILGVEFFYWNAFHHSYLDLFIFSPLDQTCWTEKGHVCLPYSIFIFDNKNLNWSANGVAHELHVSANKMRVLA